MLSRKFGAAVVLIGLLAAVGGTAGAAGSGYGCNCCRPCDPADEAWEILRRQEQAQRSLPPPTWRDRHQRRQEYALTDPFHRSEQLRQERTFGERHEEPDRPIYGDRGSGLVIPGR